jgi:hypothetical protein
MCSDLYIHPLGGEKETLKYVIINSLRVLFWSVCDFKVYYFYVKQNEFVLYYLYIKEALICRQGEHN